VVAELLRLKVRLLASAFRTPVTAAWASLGIVLAGAGVAVLWGGAAFATELDPVTLHRVVVVIGAMVSLGAFFVPLVVVRTQLLHPRALWLFGLGRFSIAGAVLLTTLVGPVLLLVPMALAPLQVWTGQAAATAALSVLLILIEGVFAARVGVALGSLLLHRRALSTLVRIVAALLLVGGLTVIVAHLIPTLAQQLPGSWWPLVLGVVVATAPLRDPAITEALTRLPIGAFWRTPSHQAAGETALVEQDLWLGGLAIGALALVWIVSLAFLLRPTRRIPQKRAARVPGWFRRLPSTPTGAVAARSFTYWARDPRYRAAVVVLPVVPVVTLLAMWLGGIPFPIAALVPLPLVVLLIAWGTLHNDVAYDSTAMWTHLAANTRGTHDRIGRMLPVLALGLPVVVVGAPLTAWAHGDWSVTPAVFGVSVAILLGGIGVSSLISARFPYPATRPGDAAFQQPQVPGASGSGIQFWSIVLILLVASPAIAAGVFHLLHLPEVGNAPWTWVALAAGCFAGALLLVIGIRVGGRSFDRRAPELLEFAARH
jgi:ABC-2 type transport system permease protein